MVPLRIKLGPSKMCVLTSGDAQGLQEPKCKFFSHSAVWDKNLSQTSVPPEGIRCSSCCPWKAGFSPCQMWNYSNNPITFFLSNQGVAAISWYYRVCLPPPQGSQYILEYNTHVTLCDMQGSPLLGCNSAWSITCHLSYVSSARCIVLAHPHYLLHQ